MSQGCRCGQQVAQWIGERLQRPYVLKYVPSELDYHLIADMQGGDAGDM